MSGPTFTTFSGTNCPEWAEVVAALPGEVAAVAVDVAARMG